ncbi:MAG: SusE domain-containing protein [Chitinophagaceae bacterium]|nr:SusE domain-containing protein [Chitinophagaceae bacterium]
MRKLPHQFLFFFCLFIIPFLNCKKQIDFTARAAHDHLPQLSLRASSSKIVMYQSNAKLMAIRFDWGYLSQIPSDPIYYSMELSLKEDQFLDPIEIPLGSSLAAGFTVEEFNQLMHKIIKPGDTGDVIARIKYMRQTTYNNLKNLNGQEVSYSDPILFQVTTYRHVIQYDYPDYMTIPGNYQSWNPLLAPRLVSKPGEKEYEGYVNFPIEYPQFLFIRGNQWSDFTFGYIGSNKFGFQGTPLSIFGGKGFYLIRASMNTNTWSYAKIKSWVISGTALGGKLSNNLEMLPDPSNFCIWRINVNLMEGEFKFKANNQDEFILGNQWPAIDDIPDYNANGIKISKSGNYTIELDLSIPGNYLFHIHLNKA